VLVKMISVILPVHNQEDIITRVLDGIFGNISRMTSEVIVILDGCTDNTEKLVNKYAPPKIWLGCKVKFIKTPDVFEVKADNAGLRDCIRDYAILVQDDMIIQELGFDIRLIKPMLVWDDVCAVTARSAHNHILGENGDLGHSDITGSEWGQPRDRFVIRQSVNRGPLALRMDVVRNLGYLDEIYAPLGWDEHDLCMRAYKNWGFVSGAYPIRYQSDLAWGTTRKNPTSASIQQAAYRKNVGTFIERHRAAILGEKHNETRMLD
jgi:glycosyltransferase involved in cell wall biosynthesis